MTTSLHWFRTMPLREAFAHNMYTMLYILSYHTPIRTYYTVETPNNGHVGGRILVEVVLISEVLASHIPQ